MPICRSLPSLALLPVLAAGPAFAGHQTLRPWQEEPAIEFDFDKPTAARHHLTERLSVGASTEFEFTSEINFDLGAEDKEDDREDEGDDRENKEGDRENKDDVRVFLPSANLSAAYETGRGLRAFGELEFERPFIDRDPDGNEADLRLKVKEAYLAYASDLFAVTVGRRQADDEREWLFDEELDGIELVYGGNDFVVSGAWWRDELFLKDLLGGHDNDEPDFFYLRSYLPVGDDIEVDAWVLGQKGRLQNRGDNLVFIGASSYGEMGWDVDYWAEGAFVIGEEDGRKVRGFGFDLGGIKTFKEVPLRPWVALGLAFGSGDDGEGTDTAFRQTGLQGNSDRIGGVTSVDYYGALVDPELSNLIIPTVAAGVRPTENTSVELVYHSYFQHRLSDELRDAELDEDPSGERRHLGHEFDLVFGLRAFDRVNFEAAGGVFLPGAAFDDDNDPAFFVETTVQLRF